MDALGSAIRIDTRGREVMRILPRINEAVNEEWISDKTRQIVDGLKTKRLDRPLCARERQIARGVLARGFQAIAAKIKQTPPERIGAIAGDLCAVEEMFALRLLMQSLGCRLARLPAGWRETRSRPWPGQLYFQSAIAGIEQADGLMIIGANPRKEAPVLNARIRKRWLKGGFPISVIGEKADLTYEYNYLGAGPETLAAFAGTPAGENGKADFLIGQGALAREDGRAILALAAKAAQALGVIKEGWNGFAILHTAAARVGGLDLGFVPGQGGLDARCNGEARRARCSVSISAPTRSRSRPGAFVIYQGTHGDRGAARADVDPAGRGLHRKIRHLCQHGGPRAIRRSRQFPARRRARGLGDPPRACPMCSDAQLPFDSLQQLRARLYARHPHFARLDEIAAGDACDVAELAASGQPRSARAFVSPIADFYLTNPIARASAVMAECSALAAADFARRRRSKAMTDSPGCCLCC